MNPRRLRRPITATAVALALTLAGAAQAQDEAAPKAAEPLVQDSEVEGVKVELNSAKRTSGNTVTINFKFMSEGSEEASYYREVGLSSTDNLIEHVYYVDAANKKKYLIVKDTQGKPLGTKLNLFSLKGGKSKAAWAKFPAPPADVKTISVYIPGAPPFEDVPLAE
ncbi:MAG: hypothetical protein ACREQ9_03885 [Candidatus Binatia bacterium]